MASRVDVTVPQIGTPANAGEPLRRNFGQVRDELDMIVYGTGTWTHGSALAVAHFGQTVTQIDPTSVSPYRRVLRLYRAWTGNTRQPLYLRFRIFLGHTSGQARIAQETIISEHNTGTGSGWSVATTNSVGFNLVSDGGEGFFIDMDAQGSGEAHTRFQVVETNAIWQLENQQARDPAPESYPPYGESLVIRAPRRADTWPEYNIRIGGNDGSSITNVAGVPYATMNDVQSIITRLAAQGIFI